MKQTKIKSIISAAALITLTATGTAFAQTASTTTTTTTAGTISEFSPTALIIRSETAPEPITYSYTEKTTYVDETGATVSREMIKSGTPVTVHYAQDGDRVIANRVVVRKSTTPVVPEAPAVIEQKKTTTTTVE